MSNQEEATREYNAAEIKAIFDDDQVDDVIIEGFKDRVRAVHEHFDVDGDGYLNFSELAALQKATEGVKLSEENFVMACKALGCQPNKGISLDALKLTYASNGASIGTYSDDCTNVRRDWWLCLF